MHHVRIGRPPIVRSVAACVILCCAAQAQAAYNVTVIASGAGSGGAWVGDTWTASAAGAQVPASEIAAHLSSGDTLISTGSGGGEAGDIAVNGAVSWSANTLTLHANRHITIDAALTGTTGAKLMLEYGQGAVEAGNGALYRINTPVSLDPDPIDPAVTATFNLTRGSDGVVDARGVPLCRPLTIPGPSSCSFLSTSDLAALDIQYRSVVLDAGADAGTLIRLDLEHLSGLLPYYGYAMDCRTNIGVFQYPNSNQSPYIDGDGTITDLPGLLAVTVSPKTCIAWGTGLMKELPNSIVSPDGIYLRFTPNAGESGDNYQRLVVVVTAARTAVTGYLVIDYLINVKPGGPNAFAFTDQSGVPLSDLRTSDAITVGGLPGTAGVSVTVAWVSVTGGEYELNGSGAWTTAGSPVINGHTVRVRHTSSASYATATDTTLTIGGGADTFTSTTLDTTPNAFSFTDQTGVALSTPITSAPVQITGINTATNWTATGSQACVSSTNSCTCDVVGWTTSGTVGNNQYLCAQHTSSATFSTAVHTVVDVGGVSDTFTSTTLARPGTTYTGSTGSGTANVTLSGGSDTCMFTGTQFIPLSSVPEPPPGGLTFPHGLFEFALGGGCTAGGTVTLTITYSSALPAGTQYWKYGPTPDNATPHWYVLPAAIVGNTVTLSITDGGLGDDDLAANGVIVDAGGPGGEVADVPTLSEWGMILLPGLLVLLGLMQLRRRHDGGWR